MTREPAAPVIIDTNVLLAGLPTARGPGPWAGIVAGMRDGRFAFVVSERLLSEYRTVPRRPVIAPRLSMTAGEVDALIDALAARAIRIEPAVRDRRRLAAPDPGDQFLFDLLAVRDDLRLVTLERRLLRHRPRHGRVLRPGAWLARDPPWERA